MLHSSDRNTRMPYHYVSVVSTVRSDAMLDTMDYHNSALLAFGNGDTVTLTIVGEFETTRAVRIEYSFQPNESHTIVGGNLLIAKRIVDTVRAHNGGELTPLHYVGADDREWGIWCDVTAQECA